jgi:hypothetical protein
VISDKFLIQQSEAQSARLSGLLLKVKSMDAGVILHELTHATVLPRAALQAASAQRIELLQRAAP